LVWGLLLRPLALVGPPEVSLRLLALAFGVLMMWLAWRLGRRLAGHAAGGLLAPAPVGPHPGSFRRAPQLKHHSAEAAPAPLAFPAAAGVGRRGRAVDVAGLVAVLPLGVTLSNAQLLVAPPLLAVLAGRALLMRDRALQRRIAVAAAVVALWNLVWFMVLVRPWLTPAMHAYWQPQYAPRDLHALGAFLDASATQLLTPALGPYGTWIVVAALAVLLATGDSRPAAIAIVLLVGELILLSLAHLFPLGVQRTNLFLSTLLLAATGAAAGRVVAGLWARAVSRPVALALVALLVAAMARGRGSGGARLPLA